MTPANVHDKHAIPQLLHGAELEVYGDSAYASQQGLIASKAPQARDRTNRRFGPAGIAADIERIVNRVKSKVRSRVVCSPWSSGNGASTRCAFRGLAKNATRAFVALGLANIYLARKHLVG